MATTVTSQIQGITINEAIKAPCKAVATSNISLAGLQTLGGVALSERDRVLVKGQTNQVDNGIYNASTSTWQRSKDFDGNRDIVQGTRVLIVNAGINGAEYEVTTANPVVIGTSSLTFQLRYGANATYDQTESEISALVTPTNLTPVLIPDVDRYGANTGGTAAANRSAIQSAFTANYGGTLRVPRGTYEVNTAGSTTAPVGDALTITGSITLIMEGIVKGTNNCNVIHVNAGAQDVVTIIQEGGGGIQGYGTFFELTNRNGSLIKVTSGIIRIYQVKLIDPPQYAVISEGADEGEVCEADIIGGQSTYPGDNHYGICLVDASLGWKIDGNKTLANGSGGKVSQAVASITLGSGTADRTQVINNRFNAQWEKGTYIIGDDAQINNNFVYGNTEGEGLRVVGKRPQVNNNKVRSCTSGGITLYDAEGAQCNSNEVSDYTGAGITLGYAGSSSGKSISRASIKDNKILGKTSGSNLVAAIDVRGDSGAATVERRIEVVGNEISTANYSTSDERAGIHILPNNSGTTFQDMSVTDNIVNDTGSYGIRFGAGIYSNSRCVENKVRDPGAQSVALGGNRSGFRWDTSVTWTGGLICDNEARSETAGSGMSYGFENVTLADIASAIWDRNHSKGHVTAAYLNHNYTTNTRGYNRQGDDALWGSFTMDAAASKAIANTNARSTLRVILYPTNAAAVALQVGTNALYFDGTVSAGVSFTLKTGAAGSAAGTETFEYELRG